MTPIKTINIEPSSTKLLESIAILMANSCFSINAERAQTRIKNLLDPMIETFTLSEYQIIEQSQNDDTGEWELYVYVKHCYNITYATITMGMKRSEGGFTPYMTLHEWNPYKA